MQLKKVLQPSLKKASMAALTAVVALASAGSTGLMQPGNAQSKAVLPPSGHSSETVAIGKKNQAVTQIAPSQAPPETWRKNAPKVPPPLEFKLPSPQVYSLANGLKVEMVEDHRFPFITVELGIKCGSTVEPREKLGLADMTADMLLEGTTTRTSKQIAQEVDFIGGGMRAGSDYDYSMLLASCLSKYTDRLFNVFSDVLLNPTFPEDELTLKKTNLIEDLAMRRAQPGFLVGERFHKVVFGSHPYSVVAPTPLTVKAITREDLEKFHRDNFIPNNSTLVVVGDFDSAKMKDLIASSFAKWQAGTVATAQVPGLPAQHGRHIYLVNRPGSAQSSIRVGNVSISRKDPNFFPMLVANQILGGAAQARLFLNIREQKGYTYGAYSHVDARKQPGAFTALADVRTEVTAPSLEEFLYELDRLRNIKPSAKELADAKNFLAGSFQLSLETQAGLAQKLLDASLYDLPNDYLETYSDKVMAVNADDVRKVARKVIDFDNLVIAVVGDAAKIEPDLEYFGPVDVYDTQGKLSTDWEKQPKPGS
jgi:predicted Zn-dependent peptidase